MLNVVPPPREAKPSSILGIGYLSNLDTGFSVNLISLHILTPLSDLSTGIIVVAQTENYTG